ncbi:MAG: YceI family protein [Roseibium sp.]
MAYTFRALITCNRSIVFALTLSLTVLSGVIPAHAEILSGRYLLKPSTIETLFSVKVLGAKAVKGRFKTVGGEMLLDAKRPEASRVKMSVDLESVETNSQRMTNFLKGPSMFDVAAHPVAVFESTSVRLTGNRSAQIDGFLTLRGKKKRASLDVLVEPASKSKDISIQAKGGFFRSLFGMGIGLPIYGDKVRLTVTGTGKRS